MVHHSFAPIISIFRQTGKSDSCTMEGLEDVWDVHDRENIIFLGWIHTHPEYDVFLSRFCLTHQTINFVKLRISNLFSDHSCSFFQRGHAQSIRVAAHAPGSTGHCLQVQESQRLCDIYNIYVNNVALSISPCFKLKVSIHLQHKV